LKALLILICLLAAVTVLFFGLALIEHMLRMGEEEMMRRYERNKGQRMPKLRRTK
jgi:hypothetical protein